MLATYLGPHILDTRNSLFRDQPIPEGAHVLGLDAPFPIRPAANPRTPLLWDSARRAELTQRSAGSRALTWENLTFWGCFRLSPAAGSSVSENFQSLPRPGRVILPEQRRVYEGGGRPGGGKADAAVPCPTLLPWDTGSVDCPTCPERACFPQDQRRPTGVPWTPTSARAAAPASVRAPRSRTVRFSKGKTKEEHKGVVFRN